MLRFLEVVVLVIATGLVADAAENLCSKRETACCHVNEFCGKVELLGRICKDLPVVCPDLEKIAPRSSISSSAFYIMPSQSYSTSQDFTISFSSSIPFEDSTSIEESVSIKESSSISTHSRTITPSSSSSTLLISSTMSMPWPNVVSSIYPYSTHHISYMTSSIAPWLPSQDVPETFRKWLLKEVQEYAKCHYGTKFCALNQECIPLNENCTIHLANDILRNSTSTPWCSNCSTGTFFCPSYMKCINVNQSCSYADLFHWHRNENFSIGPLGLVCGANETYCIFTMSCMPNTTVCEKQIHYNAKRKKAEIACKLGERFCPYTSSCKKLSDCRAAPSLNLSKALEDDYFGGWAHLCKMQNVVCPAVSHAVVKCAEARDKYDCNFCPDEHTFCTANGLCLKEGKLCCPEGEEKCNYSNSCATPSLCKGYLTSCQSVAKGFYVSSSIDANFSEVQEYEEGFKKNVSQTVINITKIHCIANVSINPGSIHVSFILVPEKGQISEDFQKALAVLQSVIESGNFNVSLPSGLQLTFNAASLVIRPVTPATTSPLATPFSMETPTKSKKNLSVIIVCSVVFGLLFLVIIAVVVNNYSALRKEKQSGRISPSQSWDLKNADQQSLEMEACGHYNKTDHPGSNNNLIVKL